MSVIPFEPIRQTESELTLATPDYQDADFTKMLAVWGNGNSDAGMAIFQALTMRLVHARRMHPLFAEGKYRALGVIGSEYQELEYAVGHESPQRQIEEAKDVAATVIRFLNGEHLSE